LTPLGEVKEVHRPGGRGKKTGGWGTNKRDPQKKGGGRGKALCYSSKKRNENRTEKKRLKKKWTGKRAQVRGTVGGGNTFTHYLELKAGFLTLRREGRWVSKKKMKLWQG